MLSGTSVSPPQLDEFFSVGEAPLRAAEFAELGMDGGADLEPFVGRLPFRSPEYQPTQRDQDAKRQECPEHKPPKLLKR